MGFRTPEAKLVPWLASLPGLEIALGAVGAGLHCGAGQAVKECLEGEQEWRNGGDFRLEQTLN
jgi:hypothetical protein